VEARTWRSHKESFDDYAIDKLALIHQLELPAKDSINLLIGGIAQPTLRATALSLRSTTVETFIEAMRHITAGVADLDRRRPANGVTPIRTKDQPGQCRNCGKNGHTHQECRSTTTCFYCKKPGHRQYECPGKKQGSGTASGARVQPRTPTVAAAVTGDDEGAATEEVAATSEPGTMLETGSPLIAISVFCNQNCKLIALIDTGSPVSFIKNSVYIRYCKGPKYKLKPSGRNLRNLYDRPLKLEGTVRVELRIAILSQLSFEVDLFVISNATLESDIILGREFLQVQKLTLVYKPADQQAAIKTNLFSVLPLHVSEDAENDLKTIISDSHIDFDRDAKDKLKAIVLENNNASLPETDDGYTVRVRLKDDSVYAYAPRRFAHAERLQLREITDDLLRRDIIKPSVSPYCARVVPVRKRNGRLRLCVDLRPLNARVIKQKYTFPVIEECLSRLANKQVFTLLDLRDSFHQIRVHEDSTKYFAFATPDGQYEFKRLPFGFCESPAEFQKRLVQILQPLIRTDRILVYIDDVLIPSVTVEQNLQTLREVLLCLKNYRFELNYKKCQFLRKSIEFLDYVVSRDGITLSGRHVEAILDFKQPGNVLEVQRFLGLANYFRRFIKDFAIKARPLYDLLRKTATFEFNDSSKQAFLTLKRELTAYPVLRLYDPAAETEVHTDACARGLGAILLQKQRDKLWAPTAYFSRPTNETESRYHSYELEMLAVVRAVERFHIYLYGIQFKIVTDCNALVYATKKASLNPRISRWILALQNYTFEVVHRPGGKMAHVDALSRSVGAADELAIERRLELLQLADPKVQDISRRLELGDDPKFTLIDGLVYRKLGDDRRFVVPNSMVHNILRIPRLCGTLRGSKDARRDYATLLIPPYAKANPRLY